MYTTPKTSTEITPSKITTDKTTTDKTTTDKTTTDKTTTITTTTTSLFGGGLGGGGGGSDKRRRFKKHEQLFEYGFRPDIAAVAEAKMLKSGSNVIFKQKSSLPTFGIALPAPQRPAKAQQKPTAPRAPPKISLPNFNVPMQQRPAKAVPRVVSTKFNLLTQKVSQVRTPTQKKVSMPQFAQFKTPSVGVTHKSSNTGLKSISLPSSLPQKKKEKK